jgi:hypothetical protein
VTLTKKKKIFSGSCLLFWTHHRPTIPLYAPTRLEPNPISHHSQNIPCSYSSVPLHMFLHLPGMPFPCLFCLTSSPLSFKKTQCDLLWEAFSDLQTRFVLVPKAYSLTPYEYFHPLSYCVLSNIKPLLNALF